jgi:cytochrome c-type biogenesis protein CcmH
VHSAQHSPQSSRRSNWSRGFAACLIAATILALAIAPSLAVEPGEKLADPALETRARHISQQLRCLVCQNQSIDDSNADLARDLRLLVRERLTAGDTDVQVLAFIEARYGEFVLLRPPFNAHTLLLWLAPLLLLLGTAYALRRHAQTHAAAPGVREENKPLTPAEKQQLDELLGKKS